MPDRAMPDIASHAASLFRNGFQFALDPLLLVDQGPYARGLAVFKNGNISGRCGQCGHCGGMWIGGLWKGQWGR
jgi:hypothetical protein